MNGINDKMNRFEMIETQLAFARQNGFNVTRDKLSEVYDKAPADYAGACNTLYDEYQATVDC